MNKDLRMRIIAEITSAYVSHNPIHIDDTGDLILQINQSITALTQAPSASSRRAAVPVEESVTSQNIICLECGRGFRLLKSHLALEHDLTPFEYRQRWKLPGDYPMVPPGYAQDRSRIAKATGLGKRKPGQQRKRQK